MNVCVGCGLDFGSVAAFDRHRVGVFAYSLWDGLRMDPPREDGRRCLNVDEIRELRDNNGNFLFAPNARGLWSLREGLAAARSMRIGSSDKAPKEQPA